MRRLVCSIAEYFNSLFVVWLALRARQNTVQLIKINQRCYSPKRLIRYISCTGNSDFVFFFKLWIRVQHSANFCWETSKKLEPNLLNQYSCNGRYVRTLWVNH